ncbi:aquaporin Z [Chamaesiphon minutus]|uniref:MIP family channel protein n=1 Tax=Chamaesiphon minutus (strain ATCC 27169 / PCC 6605) TaxID=1173020 RepID=K9UIE1_CHAP6|nr:aquaporin Z [Chamaesiphon minutus]AFY94867.1 MIP family channel protein [Chamaesiphon minutus PCC 6605]
MSLTKRWIAEFLGTFWLVLGGCGSAVFAAAYSDRVGSATKAAASLGIGTIGVALAFGLSVLTMAYAIGHISNCHLNPAVSFGLWAGKRFPASELLPYIIAQVGGSIVAALTIYFIATGKDGYALAGTNPLATNGFGVHSPQGYTLLACAITEAVMTFMFLLVILGATDIRAPQGFAPMAIGLTLILIHLISIPITNTSVNPARSTGPALVVGIFGQTELFGQLWLFWIAPTIGAIAAGCFYHAIFESAALGQKAHPERQASGDL